MVAEQNLGMFYTDRDRVSSIWHPLKKCEEQLQKSLA